MASLNLSIPNELKHKMNGFKYIDWSEVACGAILDKLQLLEKMEKLLSKSTLTEDDAIKLGRAIKKHQWKRTKKLLA